MAVQRVGDMTKDELEQLIEQVVDRRLRLKVYPRHKDSRSVREVLDSIDQHRFTPPPNAPSPLEMLREDRDG